MDSTTIDTIKILTIDDVSNDVSNGINKYILHNLDTRAHTSIYHFVIGSKTDKYALESTLPNIYRNHEFPKIVENLLFNPELQMSPTFIHKISMYKEFKIKHYLFLIDPAYKTQPTPIGLISSLDKFSMKINNIITKHNIDNTIVSVVLEPIIIPYDINQKQIENIIELINKLGEVYPLLVNILDCSSYVIKNMFCENIDTIPITNTPNAHNRIHLTLPECLLIDSKTQYLPILTFDVNTNTNTNTNTLYPRWINYRDDSHSIEDLKCVEMHCKYSKQTLHLIIILYKEICLNNSLMSLYKFWIFTTYTTDYIIDMTNPDNLDNNLDTLQTININFKDPEFNFNEFANYWKNSKSFRNLNLFNYDGEPIIIKKYISNFVIKYINAKDISYLGFNPKIVDLIKLEVFEIFTNLGYYFPTDIKYVPNSAENISRDKLRDYLILNGRIS